MVYFGNSGGVLLPYLCVKKYPIQWNRSKAIMMWRKKKKKGSIFLILIWKSYSHGLPSRWCGKKKKKKKWWLSENPANPASTLEVVLLGSYAELRNLVHRGPRSNPQVTQPMGATLKVWDTVNKKLMQSNVWSPATPLLGNPRLPHFRSILDTVVWARHGVTTLGDIVSQGSPLTL